MLRLILSLAVIALVALWINSTVQDTLTPILDAKRAVIASYEV